MVPLFVGGLRNESSTFLRQELTTNLSIDFFYVFLPGAEAGYALAVLTHQPVVGSLKHSRSPFNGGRKAELDVFLVLMLTEDFEKLNEKSESLRSLTSNGYGLY